ncbi:MAG: hypothetical protein L6Q92_04715 [Phycisphaerae bacterium]|nr:hypothetical protein [Phycisphaerae bacterium]
MSHEGVCLHALKDADSITLGDYPIVARTTTRQDLRTALSSNRPRVLVLDLDHAEATYTIVEALEICTDLCIVGVTGETDSKAMIAAVRAGCRQLSAKPLDADDLIAAIRRALNEASDQSLPGRTIGVIGAAGGCGATTIACHLADSLARQTNAPTYIADLDLEFGGVARAWDIDAVHTIADVAGAGAVDAVLLKKAATEMPNRVWVLARPRTIEEAHAVDDAIVGQLLRTARGHFASIVLDLPRKLDAVTWTAAEQCDRLLIVIQLTVPAVDNARRLMDVLNRLGMPDDRIAIVANRYRKNMHTVTPDVVENTLKRELLTIIPNDYKAVSESIDLGRPMDTRSPVYSAIAELGGKLLGAPGVSKPRGWLARLSRRAMPAR